MEDLNQLMQKAKAVYLENFPNTTCFERAVFFSWGCTINDCTFCYMSTQPKDKKLSESRRSMESIFAEFILAKILGWEIGFFSGGIGVFKPDEMEFMLKSIYEITGHKVWINIGPTPKIFLERYKPYIEGVVGSIETINPIVHKKICPSKPTDPYTKMFDLVNEMGLKVGMTIILGVGETKDDFPLLVDFIKKYDVKKIHLYSLIPHKGTEFEGAALISKEDQAYWIASLRLAFPKLDIQCGIWEDRVDRVAFLLDAGANSLSKFKVTKLFGLKVAHEIENQAKLAGREFKGTITKMPDIDWHKEVDMLSFDEDMKKKVKEKLDEYVSSMSAGKEKLVKIRS